ncbi:Arc family DNA-binding protein [Rhizobium rhizosphaerae]|nr:Arc family DNA-binding protein [Xaviernesmea rhizosphaerae]
MSDKDKYPSELAERFQVRLPAGLRDRIRAAAEANGRSMNTEIVTALEDAYPDPEKLAEELSFVDEIDSIQQQLERLRAARLAEAIKEGRREVRQTDAMIEKAEDILKSKDK